MEKKPNKPTANQGAVVDVGSGPLLGPFIERSVLLDFDISESDRSDWLKLSNTVYYGEPQIPLSVPSSQIPQSLKDVQWHIFCGKKVKVKCRLYANGSVVVTPIGAVSNTGITLPNDKA